MSDLAGATAAERDVLQELYQSAGVGERMGAFRSCVERAGHGVTDDEIAAFLEDGDSTGQESG